MTDRIREAFLERQYRDALALNADSDIVTLTPVEGNPPDRYVIDYRCRGLRRDVDGIIRPHDRFVVGVHLSDAYLKSIPNPVQVLTIMHPVGAFHPNIAERAPFICPGRLPPGMSIVELAYQLWELWTWRSFNLVDSLNAEAARYGREHRSELPLDQRPLKRHAVSFTVEAVESAP